MISLKFGSHLETCAIPAGMEQVSIFLQDGDLFYSNLFRLWKL